VRSIFVSRALISPTLGRYVKTDGAHGGVIFLRPVSLQSMPHAQLWRRHKLRFFARINKNYQICCYQSGSLHIASFATASFVRDADSLSYKKEASHNKLPLYLKGDT
jgi:hypothetical protein